MLLITNATPDTTMIQIRSNERNNLEKIVNCIPTTLGIVEQ